MMQDDLQQKRERMLTEPVEKLVCSLAVPSIVIMLITSIYNLADTYFVSGLGTSAAAAIGVVFSLMAVIQAIGFFFGHGSGNFMARKMGAKDYELAETMASTGFFLSFFFGALLSVFGLAFINPLLRALGSSETMLPYARDYMRFILIAAPFMTGSLTLNNQLRYLASAKLAMVGMVAGALLNIALDPLFIYVFGWGAAGAGVATMLSQMTGFAILLAATRRKGNIPMQLKRFKPTVYMFREIARGGLPSLLRQSLNSVGILCFNHAAGIFGDAAVAAISIVQRVTAFAISALLGFGQGFQPVCGFNFGAKQYDRVIRAFWFCAKLITAALFVLAVIGAIYAPNVIAIFRADDPEVIAIGKTALRLQCITLPFMGLVVLINMMLQTIGAAKRASTIAVCRSGLFLIPSIVILVSVFGLPGLQASQMTADILTIALALPIGLDTLGKMKKAMEENVPAP
ncbi:MATE family efflux transporter [Synergistaceae bacterium OttesenSCG-928-D05]|nr:MATE family efflux transporter [Synergistaceae bacterium OttesenSCG-928-D05]